MKVSDISNEDWNILRPDYQDELSTMKYVDDDEFEIMLLNSKKERK